MHGVGRSAGGLGAVQVGTDALRRAASQADGPGAGAETGAANAAAASHLGLANPGSLVCTQNS